MAFLPIRARYLARHPLESHLQIWEIFPNLSIPKQQGQGEKMRISDDRYSRDRLRLDLALGFIDQKPARTPSVRGRG